MYYPILRGRQNELLAIYELLGRSKLSEKIIPVIEPVKLSPTLVKTVELFQEKERELAFILNPEVGTFYSDIKNPKNDSYLRRLTSCLYEDNKILPALILNEKAYPAFEKMSQENSQKEVMAFCKTPDELQYYDKIFPTEPPCGMIVPYSTAFRRIRKNRILFEDKFNKRVRNADYANKPDEFFSNDHIYSSSEGYVGFSDYSIIGSEYSESGFAPYAVALHIVYFDNDDLRVHHFVSTDNDDAYDPASKLYQALTALMDWNKTKSLDTVGIKEFERIFNNQSYPGLGVVKKLSLMHHLELMGRFLDGDKI